MDNVLNHALGLEASFCEFEEFLTVGYNLKIVDSFDEQYEVFLDEASEDKITAVTTEALKLPKCK